MNNGVDNTTGMRLSGDKKHHGSDTTSTPPIYTDSTPPMKIEDVENAGTSVAVDAVTEAKLLRKLDIRST